MHLHWIDISPLTRRFTRAAAAGLVLASLVAVLLGWLSEEVLEGDTAQFDAFARATVHAGASPTLTAILHFFTVVGSAVVLAPLFVATVIIFWKLGWHRAAVILVVTMAGAGVLVEALKLGFRRARPSPYFGIVAPHSFSYPSGHALFSFAFFAVVAALSARRVVRVWVSLLIWACAIAVIGLIGFSRIYLGVHYPTDVVAGYMTAFVWVFSVGLGDRLHRRRHDSRPAG